MAKYFFSLFFLTCVFFSCSKDSSHVLSEEQMIDVLYDVQMANAIANEHRSQRNESYGREKIVNGVLKKHNITAEILDSSIVWYSDHLDEYRTINDSVRTRLDRTLKDVEGIHTQSGGDKNIIPYTVYLDQAKSVLDFASTSSSVNKDEFDLNFDVEGLNSKHRVELGVYFFYKDTTVFTSLQLEENAHYQVSKPNFPDSLLKDINGYIRMRKTSVNTPIYIYNVAYRKDSTEFKD